MELIYRYQKEKLLKNFANTDVSNDKKRYAYADGKSKDHQFNNEIQ